MGRAPKRERVLTAGTAYPPAAIGRYVATAPCGCRAPTRAPLRRASSIGYCCILGGTIRRWPCSLASPSGARSRPLVWWLGLSRLTVARCICHAARCMLVLHVARCTLHVARCMLHCSVLHVACCTAARRQRRVPLRREPAELCCLLSLHSVRPCRPAAARCTKPNTAALSLQPL
jgi:hypothetical protein